LFFRPLYLIAVRSLTEIKNHFVRSYPAYYGTKISKNMREEGGAKR
jgi:hypothetical protein